MIGNDVKNLFGVVKLVSDEDSREEVSGIFLKNLRKYIKESVHGESAVDFTTVAVEEGAVLVFAVDLGEATPLRLIISGLPATDASENMLLCTDNPADKILGLQKQGLKWVTDEVGGAVTLTDLLFVSSIIEPDADEESAVFKVISSKVGNVVGEVLQLDNHAEARDILVTLGSL